MNEVQKRTFKDAAGVEYSLRIDYGVIARVADKTKIQIRYLLKGDMSGYIELFEDPVQFIDVMAAALGDQITVPITEWKNSLQGDVIEDMMDCFKAAFRDFSPRHQIDRLDQVTALNQANQEKVISMIRSASGAELISGELDANLRRLQERSIASSDGAGVN